MPAGTPGLPLEMGGRIVSGGRVDPDGAGASAELAAAAAEEDGGAGVIARAASAAVAVDEGVAAAPVSAVMTTEPGGLRTTNEIATTEATRAKTPAPNPSQRVVDLRRRNVGASCCGSLDTGDAVLLLPMASSAGDRAPTTGTTTASAAGEGGPTSTATCGIDGVACIETAAPACSDRRVPDDQGGATTPAGPIDSACCISRAEGHRSFRSNASARSIAMASQIGRSLRSVSTAGAGCVIAASKSLLTVSAS